MDLRTASLWVALPYLPSATCPHCAGLRIRSCHVCDGYRVIGDMGKLRDAARYVWAKRGCRCDACLIVGRRMPEAGS